MRSRVIYQIGYLSMGQNISIMRGIDIFPEHSEGERDKATPCQRPAVSGGAGGS